MRVLGWNIRGGGRTGVDSVVDALKPDVAVLTECRPSRHVALATALRGVGLHWVVGTNEGGYTGILVASNVPIRPGPTHSTVLPARWCHVDLPDLGMSFLAIYGPLRVRGRPGMVSAFWNELVSAGELLDDIQAVIIGDLNTAPAKIDSTSGLPLPAANQMRELLAKGWRDAFRQVNDQIPAYSYWDSRGQYRIDHCLLSPASRPACGAAYVCEAGGFGFGPRSEPEDRHISDHAALVVDF